MSEFLLAISIGPVQELISAARRTRDLWFGSLLLSEISKAAAEAIGPERLIFPAPEALKPDGRVANIILAQVADRPKAYRDRAKDAAESKWKGYIQEIWPLVTPFVDWDRWNRQAASGVLEFYAAWAPLGAAGYRSARRDVMRLLAGRKACRNFDAWQGEEGVPKSSLDGARESVWRNETATDELNRSLKRRLRLAPKEQLDLIGLVKRLGGGRQPYPSVSRLAADPWLRGLAAAELAALRERCDPLAQAGILGGIGARYPQYADFPYEGTAAYRNRFKELAREAGLDEKRAEDSPQLRAIRDLDAEVKKLEKHGIPDPYLAVLAADGDFMGRTISDIESRPEHCELSRKLTEFAAEAEAIVKKHRGALVYSGGDDVLAFLPVDLCVACARSLHDSFEQHLRHCKSPPSLSVGIAIGHFMEPLEDLLAYARAAEKGAKSVDGKNALAVHLHPRGGAPVELCASWVGNPDAQLAALVRMYLSGRLPHKAAYELHALGQFYEGWPAGRNAAIVADAARWLKRKRVDSPDPEWIAMAQDLHDSESIDRVAGMMLVARKLARNAKQATPSAATPAFRMGSL
jgi:CRISPR-associated protein Cmr2